MSDYCGRCGYRYDATNNLYDAKKRIKCLESQIAEKDKEIKHSWVAGARHESMCRSEEIKALKSEIAADDRNVNNLMDQVHALSQEIERMRPVVEAAQKFDANGNCSVYQHSCQKDDDEIINLIQEAADIIDGEALALRECSTTGPDHDNWTGEDDAFATYQHWKQVVAELYALAERIKP